MKNTILSILFITIISQTLQAQKTDFGAPFSDNMVLQRNASVKIWGSDTPGKSVNITTSWNNKSYNATCNNEGRWSLNIETPEGSENAYTVKLTGSKTITLKNVLIGEVWLCSGQSNMVRPLRDSHNGPVVGKGQVPEGVTFTGEIDADKYVDNGVRFLRVTRALNLEEQNDIPNKWTISSKTENRAMGAVAFYFGRKLRDSLKVPIGLIWSAYGSSSVEAWLKRESVNKFNFLKIPNVLPERHDMREPTVCYNAMIHPLVGYGIKGVIWYQGETGGSTENLPNYKTMFYELINSWRNMWGIGNFSFNYVQIVPYVYKGDELRVPAFYNMLRETLYKIDNTGMAVTMDHPSCNQIHPKMKQYVGDRLAYWVLNKTYGFKNVVPSGPIATSAQLKGNSIKIHFDYAETGLVQAGSNGFKHFEVAGADKVYHSAEVKVNSDNTLTLSCSAVESPKFVRYAYVDCPDLEATLFNGAGLPASAFELEVSSQ